MTRLKRMGLVQRVVDDAQRERAEQLATIQQRVTAAEDKLVELERYHADYAREFNVRAAAGGVSAGLRDFQVFLARLADAVGQQRHVVARVRAEAEFERGRWQDAARRSRTVGAVIERWQTEDRRALDQREQRESDERAQRSIYRSAS